MITDPANSRNITRIVNNLYGRMRLGTLPFAWTFLRCLLSNAVPVAAAIGTPAQNMHIFGLQQ
jgi:hypothetical protein